MAKLIYQPRREGVFGDSSLQKTIDDLLKSKQAGNRRPAYVASLKMYLDRFAKAHHMPIQQVTTGCVETWLTNFTQPNTRQTWLNRLSTLFSWAKRREIIRSNPCDNVERSRIDRRAPRVLTPTESRSLLASCPTAVRPYLVLGMFAGIRPDELHRLTWADVNLETATVRVVIGKTRRSRIVPLQPIAVKLLQDHPLKSGPISPSVSTVRRFKRAARGILGDWPADILRHTAASYLLALHKDAGKVSMMLGNSSSILLTHYHTPVTQEDCDRFWQT